eukprot:PLAT70.1.p1 GENE.PLAT70.1~~PLAT70.1.p1  ORF type:complete len:270 (-),score=117.05 PLAT70.1:165-974(-)
MADRFQRLFRMASVSRSPFVGGNWKTNGTRESVATLVEILNGEESLPAGTDVVVAPPSLFIDFVMGSLRSEISVASQNVWTAEGYGAYTGELTATMLSDFGLKWVIVGHSERRHKIGETDKLLAAKTRASLDAGLSVIFCIGETLEQHEAGQAVEVTSQQLLALSSVVAEDEWDRIVVAYEPVWAIGTGLTATPDQAQEVHSELRSWLSEHVGDDIAAALRIIYGGSVKPKNCEALFAKEDIDGFLVGGASLKADFHDIIKCTAAKARL